MKRLFLLLVLSWFMTGISRAYQSTTDWQNVPITAQNGTFTVTFDITPQQAGMDGFVGLSQGNATTFNNMACSVRVYTNNRFEAFNGSGYTSSSISYLPGHTYHIAMTVNVPAKTYSVTVDGQPLAQDYAFRTTVVPANTTQLGSVVVKHQSGSYALDALTLEGPQFPPYGDFPIYEKVASFTSMLETGEPPRMNVGHRPEELIAGPDGYFYGTTDRTIFKMSPDGKLRAIVEGPEMEGQDPTLCFLGYDGNLYGYKSTGFGSVFKVTPGGTLTTLVTFTGTGGTRPGRAPVFLVQLSDGSIAGITSGGGLTTDHGTVFRISATGTFTHLRSFTGPSGAFPGKNPVTLVDGKDGKLYGIAKEGGMADAGVVFGLQLTGQIEFAKEFTGLAGAQRGRAPDQLHLAGSGVLFGTTASGGTDEFGTVYKLTRSGTWSLIDEIANHEPDPGDEDGFGLDDAEGFLPLVETYSGKLYCALKLSYQGGVIFEIQPQGGLHRFQVIASALKRRFREQAEDQYSDIAWGTLSSFMLAANGTMWIAADLADDTGSGYEFGAVFSFPESGEIQLSHSFHGDFVDPVDGMDPAFLVEGSDGAIYGTTIVGGEGWGSETGDGTVFKIEPSGEWKTIVNFGIPSYPSPRHPHAAIIQGSDGHLHGTSRRGGDLDYGTVFKLSLTGALESSKGFTGNIVPFRAATPTDGIFPTSELVEISQGRYLGTTGSAEALAYDEHYPSLFEADEDNVVNWIGNLNVDELATDSSRWWTQKVSGGLFRDTTGQLYCTDPGRDTWSSEWGYLLQIGSAGVVEAVRNADGTAAGHQTYGALASGLFNGQPALYGVSPLDGAYGHGQVFRIIPGVSTTTIFSFNDAAAYLQGKTPLATLLIGQDGLLYGTTAEGGAHGHGIFFRIWTDGSEFEKLADFSGLTGAVPGSRPVAGLTQMPNGDIYGTTSAGGASDRGTIFRRKASGEIETVFDFSADPLDSQPLGRLVLCSDGNLYGTAAGDEVNGSGGVYRLVFEGAPAIYPLAGAPLSSTQFRVRAKLNGRGSPSTAIIRFSTSEANLASQPPVTLASLFGGYRTIEVGATLSNLSSGLTYYYRIESTNIHGTTTSEVGSFVTSGAPSASLANASDVNTTSARLSASVNARNSETKVTFEYGFDSQGFPHTRVVDPSPNGDTAKTVEAFATGLLPGTTYQFRVRAENAVGEVLVGVGFFTTLAEPEVETGIAKFESTTRAEVHATVTSKGGSAAVRFEYRLKALAGQPPGTVSSKSAGTVTEATPNQPVSTILQLPADSQGKTYEYRVVAKVESGSTILETEGKWEEFTLNILSGLDQKQPFELPPPSGMLTVNLSPADTGGWRFAGETRWRLSGESATGLASGERLVEFLPVPGFIQPPGELVEIFSGDDPEVLDAEYFFQAGTTTATGGLQVTIEPAAVRNAANAPRWRLLGVDEGNSGWRASGQTRTGLRPGSYLVECENFDGRVTPQPSSIQITSGSPKLTSLTYAVRPPVQGELVQPVNPSVFSNASLPLSLVGQLRGPQGTASGFAVKSRVVATAAHVVFDDATKAYVTDLQWLHQRHVDLDEPVPQTPRGFFIPTAYEAERKRTDIVVIPGQGTDRSQHYDYAALFFLSDIARGGFSGFLASEGDENEFLTNATSQKILAGYATDIANAGDRGKLHATTFTGSIPAFALEQVAGTIQEGSQQVAYGTYTTTALSGRAGCSGGPLFVRHANGSFYPAAIYIGDSGPGIGTVVRGIDRRVVELFGLAETRSYGGGNSTDGGKTLTTTSLGTATERGALAVVLLPEGLPGAGWRLLPGTTVRDSGYQRDRLRKGTYRVWIAPVEGYLTPAEETVTITAGELLTFTYTYQSALTPQQSWRQAHFGSPDNTGPGADTADPDGDGTTNLDEYAAGSDPKNRTDFFRVNSSTRGPTSFTVTLTGKKDRTYTLQRRDPVTGSWTPILPATGPLQADDPTLDLTDDHPLPGQGLYRVIASPPP